MNRFYIIALKIRDGSKGMDVFEISVLISLILVDLKDAFHQIDWPWVWILSFLWMYFIFWITVFVSTFITRKIIDLTENKHTPPI